MWRHSMQDILLWLQFWLMQQLQQYQPIEIEFMFRVDKFGESDPEADNSRRLRLG